MACMPVSMVEGGDLFSYSPSKSAYKILPIHPRQELMITTVYESPCNVGVHNVVM